TRSSPADRRRAEVVGFWGPVQCSRRARTRVAVRFRCPQTPSAETRALARGLRALRRARLCEIRVGARVAPPEDESGVLLKAVLLADVTGFSRIMGEDEAAAIAMVAAVRQAFTEATQRYSGYLQPDVGDCFVALFDSALQGVRAAIDIQNRL